MDHYQTLGVERDASAEQIKAAYRRLARKYHPDVSGEKDAHDKIKAINEAYGVLGDEDKRRAYNRKFERGTTEEFFADDGFPGGLHDLFNSLFSRQGSARSIYRLGLTLEQVYKGGVHSIVLQGKSMTVDIPAGIDNGTRLFLDGDQGVVLEVLYQPHPHFQVEGGQVLGTVKIPPWVMALGGQARVNTLGGSVLADIPAGIKPGQRIHLAGRGMPSTKTRATGGHWALVEADIPTPTTKEQKAAYKRLLESFEKKSGAT